MFVAQHMYIPFASHASHRSLCDSVSGWLPSCFIGLRKTVLFKSLLAAHTGNSCSTPIRFTSPLPRLAVSYSALSIAYGKKFLSNTFKPLPPILLHVGVGH